ncbi:MAG TPA: 7-cyano-7-deazaguanine synthase QueC [Candidatus Cloacimonas sp.]|jgi:7-cyano-7-deazaguanine synthase|nr:7-cyano-7-deazaguanine synthase QueC [Candidatus Cloacimonas sp.]MDD3869081.1 7-cyano-7-deazaguanine synthase QueC [Candidatus Cloacimonadota bacterium]HOG26502.1 7-cyano-7-deazaguanine synthase QueC [Candidatus Cloacimonas sp.]HOQ77411.1 7-cyano-7-deazaguanine synthase QueC [Candidatus Cloacimonas sp.]HOU26262.1 7-cyano-7-deazaguanine synthase QueC [Candidatus Cloacimonas sp.]
MTRSIVLVSGGMDSLVTAACAVSEVDEVFFLHFNYGQLTEQKELACFAALADYYKPFQAKVVDYQWLSEIGGSALTDRHIPVPEGKISSKEIPITYVPFRNAIFLCAAVAWAEVIKATKIYIGAVEEDSSGYPDCREVFFKSFEKVIATGTKSELPINIITPVLHKSKSEIVQMGIKLKAPFHLSWSCYSDDEIACGVCESCLLRKRAFREAGIIDPIPYRN